MAFWAVEWRENPRFEEHGVFYSVRVVSKAGPFLNALRATSWKSPAFAS